MSPSPSPQMNLISKLIFTSRWLQLPLYLGLIIAQAVYAGLFVKEVVHLVMHSPELTEVTVMLTVLSLIDVVMVSNLLIMVIIGGYETFVSRLGIEGHPDEPEWLDHVNAGLLKVKLAMALISISSIHLLKTFIEAESKSNDTIMWQVIIHMAFLLSALIMAWVDKISSNSHPHLSGPRDSH
jgi:uncharacterized protein (TIGR00645 family)